MCIALNLTGDACYTLIPDSADNMTNVIEAMHCIRDTFGPSHGAGKSVTAWLQDKLGPVGATLVQILGALVVAMCVMFFLYIVVHFCKGNNFAR